MEIQVGQPPADGRYVAFVQCASAQIPDWCEPVIATWHGGKWHLGEAVYGWIGPLPLAKGRDLILKSTYKMAGKSQEYDL